MLNVLLAVVGALGLVVAAVSGRLRRTPLSAPLLALLTGVALGPEALGAVDLPTVVEGHKELHEVSRLLLAVSVMAVALRYPFPTGEPAEEGIAARTRQLLSLKSGANDGLALPLVLAAVAIAGQLTGTRALTESLWQVLGALVLGMAAGRLGGRVLRVAERSGSISPAPTPGFWRPGHWSSWPAPPCTASAQLPAWSLTAERPLEEPRRPWNEFSQVWPQVPRGAGARARSGTTVKHSDPGPCESDPCAGYRTIRVLRFLE
ncbi:hypothetical protein VSS38_02085 [Streptomyces albogriseolus]|uniref:hypothetical protein n=1 Tax=Streptomyces TaxID=1883 RepID=UPI00159ECBA9|nr:hypothetical protein [Streptomyces sp. F-7]